jgi:PhnB protein
MRFMAIVKANRDSEAGVMPPTDVLSAMGKYNEELVKAGVMLAGEGLHPSSQGLRIRFSGKQRTVIDGPFAETKELIAGFWLWQVRTREEAIEWLKRAPFDGGAEVELRPVFEADDFGAALTPELREQEERLRAQAGQRPGQPLDTAPIIVQPYLSFEGRCEEALDFYRKAVGAEVKTLMRYADSPAPPPEGMLPPGSEKKVMHAEFRIGETMLMASDGMCGKNGKASFQGFSISLTPPGDAEAKRLYEALAEGGEVRMPLAPTFFATSFGMVADRFGAGWMVVVRR